MLRPWGCKESGIAKQLIHDNVWQKPLKKKKKERNSKSYKENSKRQYNYLRNKLNKWKDCKINKQKDEIEIQQKNQISGAELLNQLDEKCIKIHWK